MVTLQLQQQPLEHELSPYYKGAELGIFVFDIGDNLSNSTFYAQNWW